MAIEWFNLERRQVLRSGVAAGAVAAVGAPRVAQAQTNTTRIRTYADIQVLDPAVRRRR